MGTILLGQGAYNSPLGSTSTFFYDDVELIAAPVAC